LQNLSSEQSPLKKQTGQLVQTLAMIAIGASLLMI
jgi:hypothetical protein